MSVITKIGQKGFSLPEIMIALGLLGGISIVTMKLIENQANNKAHLEGKAEILKTTSLVKSLLNNPDTCRNMLKNQPINSALNVPVNLSPPVDSPSLYPGLYQKIRNGAGTALKAILVSNNPYSKFRIGDIQLEKKTATENNMATVDLILPYYVESKNILFKSDGNNANDRRYLQRIPLFVTISSPNPSTDIIKDCGMVLSAANMAAKEKFCKSLGNMTDWVANECVIKGNSNCPFGQVPDTQSKTATSTYNCVNILDKFDAYDMFSEASCPIGASGSFGIISNGGKLEIRCY